MLKESERLDVLIDGGDDHHNGVRGSASSCGSIERVLLKKAYHPQRNTSMTAFQQSPVISAANAQGHCPAGSQ